jgi:2-C-methyl-D-erythritol 4-phosphate cytidylyltransferase
MVDNAIIVAGGQGNRMNSKIPKQFLLLCGEPVLFYSIRAFYAANTKTNIILVLPQAYIGFWKDLCTKFMFEIKHTVVEGAETRTGSVANGLKIVNEGEFTAIHDGARPLVDVVLINRLTAEARKYGNAVPAVSPVESVRVTSGPDSKPVDRSQIKMVQTPQVFRTEELRKAYQRMHSLPQTDDASLMELEGVRIHLTEGTNENLKITRSSDIVIAEALLKHRDAMPGV